MYEYMDIDWRSCPADGLHRPENLSSA